MSKYTELAQQITKEVGGKENINGLTHCITRLRFKLKDESLANTDTLKNMDGVVTVMQAGGQYQVVIGNHVPEVFKEVVSYAGIDTSKAVDMGEQKTFDKLIDIISGCFQPFLAVLAGGGMIRGLAAVLVFFNVIQRGDGTFIMLDNMGDTVFMFMPVIIGVTAARKFKVPEFVGLLLGAILMNPNLQLNTLSAAAEGVPQQVLFAGTIFETPIFQTFFGIPFMARNYASSVIPIIFVVLLASQVQKVAKKIVPEMIQNFFVPMLTILVTMPLAFLIVGPVFSFATDILMAGFEGLLAFSPIVYGAVLGFTWQILVMFGMHWAVIPLMFVQFGANGFQNILVANAPVSFAQTAALVALYFKLKDPKQKSLAIPAIISGIVGITEPAIYGFTLPRKKVFIYTCIAGGVAGAFVGAMNLTAWNQGGLGIFTIPNYIRPDGGLQDVITLLIGIGIAVVLGFTLTWFLHKEPEAIIESEENANYVHAATGKGIVASPVQGLVRPLVESSDPVFSEGHMGQGVVIEPTIGEIHAPFAGTVTALFPTKHAIGLTSEDGLEVLIHVGVDTVELEGQGFQSVVNQGDHVNAGDLVLSFNIDEIKEAGYKTETPVIITNSESFSTIEETVGELTVGSALLKAVK